MHLQMHAHGLEPLGQGQQLLGVHGAGQVLHEVKAHPPETQARQALELGVGHVQRHQGNAQVAALAGGDGVFQHPVVLTVDHGLDHHTTLNAQVLVQGKQGFLGGVHRGDVAGRRKRKALGWAKHVHMGIAGQGGQLEPGGAGLQGKGLDGLGGRAHGGSD